MYPPPLKNGKCSKLTPSLQSGKYTRKILSTFSYWEINEWNDCVFFAPAVSNGHIS